MGKFILHGVLVEEPKRTTTPSGVDCVTLVVEEKFRTAFSREMINLYSIDFIGKAVNCIPESAHLVGAPVVISGSLRSRMYKDKYYNDLIGDTITIINTEAFARKPVREQASVQEEIAPKSVGAGNLDNIEVDDDDLPF